MNRRLDEPTGRLAATLENIGEVAVAVSGGVDSMTLAVMAHRVLPGRATMLHATSPAVPPEASARVRRYAAHHGWELHVVAAGEFDDDAYLRNPVNRCFFCKTNLYAAIARRTKATIVSGTNLDDLGDFRPGLDAARDYGVRHPWVEARCRKVDVRAIARALALDDVAELPAAPCLSSRIETGLPITPPALEFVHRVERLVVDRLGARTVRCRIRHDGTAVELDAEALGAALSKDGAGLRDAIADLSAARGYGRDVRYEPYRMGSAFRRDLANGS